MVISLLISSYGTNKQNQKLLLCLSISLKHYSNNHDLSELNFVSRVPSCPTCLRALRALCVFVLFPLTCFPFFSRLTCLHFLLVLHVFIFLPVLHAFNILSVSNFWHDLCAFIFLYKTWNNPELTATSRNKQEQGRINGK